MLWGIWIWQRRCSPRQVESTMYCALQMLLGPLKKLEPSKSSRPPTFWSGEKKKWKVSFLSTSLCLLCLRENVIYLQTKKRRKVLPLQRSRKVEHSLDHHVVLSYGGGRHKGSSIQIWHWLHPPYPCRKHTWSAWGLGNSMVILSIIINHFLFLFFCWFGFLRLAIVHSRTIITLPVCVVVVQPMTTTIPTPLLSASWTLSCVRPRVEFATTSTHERGCHGRWFLLECYF